MSYGGGFVYNQIETVFSQYELEIYEVTRGRGTYICKTNEGRFVLTNFRGTKEKGMFLWTYLAALKKENFLVEQIKLNRDGEAVTIDEGSGERFLLKEYIDGTELNVNHLSELKEAASHLASYHNTALAIQTDVRMEEGVCTTKILEEKGKHYRELIKTKNYVRNRKKKNEFERLYLNHYEPMLQKAKESIFILDKNSDEELPSCFCHGDYNQHNILWTGEDWKITNFENFTYRWCIVDLANFLRKMLEKNDWDMAMGHSILESYMSVRPLSKAEKEKLYGLLLFPEKFWKITNHYMNVRKNRIAERDIEKLKKVMGQEEKRLIFIENLFVNAKE